MLFLRLLDDILAPPPRRLTGYTYPPDEEVHAAVAADDQL